MNQQNADAVLVRKGFQRTNVLVVTGVHTATLVAGTDFLQGVNDHQPGIRMVVKKADNLLLQALPNARTFGLQNQLLPALLGPANRANPAGSKPGIIHLVGGIGVDSKSSAEITFGNFVVYIAPPFLYTILFQLSHINDILCVYRIVLYSSKLYAPNRYPAPQTRQTAVLQVMSRRVRRGVSAPHGADLGGYCE